MAEINNFVSKLKSANTLAFLAFLAFLASVILSIAIGTGIFYVSILAYFIGIMALSILWVLLKIDNQKIKMAWFGFVAGYLIAFLVGMEMLDK